MRSHSPRAVVVFRRSRLPLPRVVLPGVGASGSLRALWCCWTVPGAFAFPWCSLARALLLFPVTARGCCSDLRAQGAGCFTSRGLHFPGSLTTALPARNAPRSLLAQGCNGSHCALARGALTTRRDAVPGGVLCSHSLTRALLYFLCALAGWCCSLRARLPRSPVPACGYTPCAASGGALARRAGRLHLLARDAIHSLCCTLPAHCKALTVCSRVALVVRGRARVSLALCALPVWVLHSRALQGVSAATVPGSGTARCAGASLCCTSGARLPRSPVRSLVLLDCSRRSRSPRGALSCGRSMYSRRFPVPRCSRGGALQGALCFHGSLTLARALLYGSGVMCVTLYRHGSRGRSVLPAQGARALPLYSRCSRGAPCVRKVLTVPRCLWGRCKVRAASSLPVLSCGACACVPGALSRGRCYCSPSLQGVLFRLTGARRGAFHFPWVTLPRRYLRVVHAGRFPMVRHSRARGRSRCMFPRVSGALSRVWCNTSRRVCTTRVCGLRCVCITGVSIRLFGVFS